MPVSESIAETPLNKGKLFISHSSKDKEVVERFVYEVLRLGFGVPPETIFCTSIESMGITSGTDFKRVIAEQLKTARAIIQIISKNYKKSEVCLNEMGAAWVLDIPVIPFVLKPVNYRKVGFIHSTTQLLRLNEKKDLLKFYQEHKQLLVGNRETNVVDLTTHIDKFTSSVK